MTLADSLQAKKSIMLRRYSTYAGRSKRMHQFVGSLMVPKQLDDGTYPVVDVWTRAMDEVVITPYVAEPKKLPPLFIGAGELNFLSVRDGHRLLHIDTVRGVEPAGYGFGFTLYAAAALSAKFAGPDGIFSISGTRSIDASELWARMHKLTFSWMSGPLAKSVQLKFDTIDYILGQSVLDSGMVVRIGEKYGRPWASFRKPPTTNFAYGLKFKAKKLDAWAKYMAKHAA